MTIPRLTDPRGRGVGHFPEEKTSQSLLKKTSQSPPPRVAARLSRGMTTTAMKQIGTNGNDCMFLGGLQWHINVVST